MRGVRQLLPNNAMQTDKVNLSRLLLQEPRLLLGPVSSDVRRPVWL